MRLTALLRKFISAPEFGPLVLLAVEVLIFTVRSPAFLSAGNISNLLAFTPELGMITLGMTLLMTAGEFDLSVGSVFGFAPIMMWTFYNAHIGSLEVGFWFAMVVSALIGFINGWMVTRLRIPSFLVTLGMQFVVRGTALYITNGFPQHTWTANSTLLSLIVGQFSVGSLRIYASLLWFILFAIILGYVLTQSKAGNWIQAAGGNEYAARARGVRVRRTEILLLILTAAISAYACATSSVRVSAANPNSGTGYELEVIAMVVIGGTALTGGRGTLIRSALGIFLLRGMRQGIVNIR